MTVNVEAQIYACYSLKQSPNFKTTRQKKKKKKKNWSYFVKKRELSGH